MKIPYPEIEDAQVLTALSGGVDSSVAAALLHARGTLTTGAYMKNWINEINVIGECPWEEDVKDARAVAEKIGIPFEIVNLMEDYKTRIVDYLLKGYSEGITPNPDVMCNREIKFGVFLDYALEQGFDAVATGHYAQNRLNADGTWDLLEGADPNKDQSYFLALMQQAQIARARFPIGHLLKPEVRDQARAFHLPTAHKKDSQGICFIGQVKMSDFLAMYMPKEPGPIVDTTGKVLGQHEGLHYFTLGQRKGLRVPSNTFGEHYVVVEKQKTTKALVIAFDRPDSPQLYAKACTISNISRCNRPLDTPARILARPRYRAPATPIQFLPEGKERARIEWEIPQRALAPGQICALYDGPVVLGGGIFEEIFYA